MATFLPITSNFPNRGSRNFRSHRTMCGGTGGIQTLRGALGKGLRFAGGTGGRQNGVGAIIYILLHLSAT